MTAEYFEKCLQKIINEDPFSVTVFLYGINEPLLDRDLPAKIGLCKKYGLSCGFSTNCTVAYDYRSLMESQPDWIRVSISGVKENYENMHRGARWKTLSANLRELSKQRDTASPETKIELFFHRYRHNACDIPIAQELADELNLEFHTIEASIIGMESVYSYLEGLPIPFAMRDALPLLLHSPEETAARALQLRHVPCEQKNMLRIEADGRMSACQCWEASIIGDATFLQTPLQEIRKLHDANPLCRHCMKKGLQHYYGVVFNEDDRTDN